MMYVKISARAEAKLEVMLMKKMLKMAEKASAEVREELKIKEKAKEVENCGKFWEMKMIGTQIAILIILKTLGIDYFTN